MVFLVGKPIPVKKCSDPSQEEIDKVHTLYIESLVKLHKDHKKMYSKHPDLELTLT